MIERQLLSSEFTHFWMYPLNREDRHWLCRIGMHKWQRHEYTMDEMSYTTEQCVRCEEFKVDGENIELNAFLCHCMGVAQTRGWVYDLSRRTN